MVCTFLFGQQTSTSPSPAPHMPEPEDAGREGESVQPEPCLPSVPGRVAVTRKGNWVRKYPEAASTVIVEGQLVVDLCPGAVVTKDHTLGDVGRGAANNGSLFTPSSGGQRSEVKMSAGPCSLHRLEGGSFLTFFSFWGPMYSLACGLVCLSGHVDLSLFLLLFRSLGPILLQSDLILTYVLVTSAKILFPIKITITGYQGSRLQHIFFGATIQSTADGIIRV